MEQALENADAELTTRLGVHHEQASARVWHGQVLVEWQADDAAGGCLLRPALVRSLAPIATVVSAGAAAPVGQDALP